MASAADDALQQAADRIAQYETQTRDLARARIGADVAQIQAQFRADVTYARAHGDPQLLTDARRRASASLKALRPAVAPLLRPAVADGVRLGANLAGGTVPAGVKPFADPAMKVTLQRINTPIRRHARLSAHAVMTHPVRTDRQLDVLIDRIGAVLAEVDAAVGTVTNRAVSIGVTAVNDSQGTARIWVVRTNCCPICAGYSGSIAGPGHGFHPRSAYADSEGQWEDAGGGISGPPLHAHCKCWLTSFAPRLAERLARKTEEDIAAGRVAASMPARIRAIDRMLAADRTLTQRTRERALKATARGRVGAQRTPTDPRRRSA